MLSGVCESAITVPAVSAVSRRHLRQRRTPGRLAKTERLSRCLTMAADKPAVPAGLLQVSGAGCVVREQALKLWERRWEPKISVLMNVHQHGRILELVAVGNNRIGILQWSRGARPSPSRHGRA